MADPPALAFASNVVGSDAPTVAYAATVYPLTTLLRILAAQALAIALVG
jgi:putative transport protein